MIVTKEPHFHWRYLLTHHSWVMSYRFSWIWRCMEHPVQHPYQTWPLLIVGSILLLNNKVFYPNLGRQNSSTWIAFQIFNYFFIVKNLWAQVTLSVILLEEDLSPKFLNKVSKFWAMSNLESRQENKDSSISYPSSPLEDPSHVDKL